MDPHSGMDFYNAVYNDILIQCQINRKFYNLDYFNVSFVLVWFVIKQSEWRKTIETTYN
jgi:hypothetical protein